MDLRDSKLAKLLVEYSCRLKPGEKVLIDYEGAECKHLVKEIVKYTYEAGAMPYINIRDAQMTRALLMNATEEQIKFQCECELREMQGMDAWIGIRGGANSAELADVPAEKLNMYDRIMSPVLNYRVEKTKWVILRYPTMSMAQQAGTSQESFADFFFDVCTLDYSKMSKAMDVLVEYMNKTDKVRLVAPGTDLTFSIKDIPAIKCAGECNIPDGEIYTAPVKDSMNGYITYNTVSQEQGFTYENIHFDVENGRIVNATANDNERINQLLDTDEGARYFGEFAIGVNPYVLHPMKDTLFDEKIAGSIHLTPGMCYDDAPNGNDSAVHWDLVLIQREDYGGGELYFDDVLVRKDGLFVIPELECLNPENLK